MSTVHPVHLREEGYKDISIALEDPPSGLVVTGDIDVEDDWIIRLSVTPRCNDIIDEDVDVRYTVFANGEFSGRTVTHIAAKGVIHIIAGPIP